ncbi:MAG: phosphotransferase [Clostridiales bacterium]|nr:phosphotransferase [Clostridiales bacterium]
MPEKTIYDNFTEIEPIKKGWSEDKKYRVKDDDGKYMLLRISAISEVDRKSADFEMMKRVYAHGIPTPQPLGFGICNDGKSCYSLFEWIDGEDLETALPQMSETEQYVLGIKAGEALRIIHTLPIPDDTQNWANRYFAVIDERIDAFRSEGIPFEGSETILEYLERNRFLLSDRPQCFIHGDFHEGNLMIDSSGKLYIIDWLDEGFGNCGDPWYDFKTFGENNNSYFSTGFVCGYFGGKPPLAFWDVLTYYIITAALTSIVWIKYHKPEELPETLKWNESNAKALRENRSPLMKWYLKDFYIQLTDSVPYKLKSPFNFSFLGKYGRVFKVFDDQDSGNICFGTSDGGKRYFIKFAGAPTERAGISAEKAISNLKRAAPIYKDLAHPNLIKFVSAEEIGGGFAMVFEWADAECMHPMYPRSRKKFMQMNIETRLQVFSDILAFHAHVAREEYVAIDFYDGSIMYDFRNRRTLLCDIDFYAKAPYVNNMGRLWGSSRFMSPEEFQLGAAIDEVTNVYTMGATAFALFSNERDRRIENWKLSKELFAIAKRAVSNERGERQQSIKELVAQWEAAR